MLRSLKIQLKILFQKKEYKAALVVSVVYACVSFLFVLKQYQSVDAIYIKDANQLICYMPISPLWAYFRIIYPFLIVLPFSTSYIDDYKNQLLPVYFSRSGRKNYFISKQMACFLGTAAVIFFAFLLNLILCNIFFPHNHNLNFGEYQLGNYYRTLLGTNNVFHTDYPRIPFMGLFLHSAVLYNIVYLVLFSLFSGLLGTFILTLSFLYRKNKIILFFPLFVLLQVFQVLDGYQYSLAMNGGGHSYVNLDILSYVIPSQASGCNPAFISIVVLSVVFVIVCISWYMIKKEDIRDLQ